MQHHNWLHQHDFGVANDSKQQVEKFKCQSKWKLLGRC